MSGEQEVERVAKRLREAAGFLNRFAGVLMVATIVFVFVGIYFFNYAGSLDTDEVQTYEDVKKNLAKLSGFVDSSNHYLGQTVANFSSLREDILSRSPGPNGVLSDDFVRATELAESMRSSLVRHTDQITFLTAQLERLSIGLDHRDPLKLSTSQVIVSQVTTRAGIVILLLLFVQILAVTYRYNVRLAAYYNSRADALDLLASCPDEKALSALTHFLAPETLDFPQPPGTMIGELASVIRDLREK